MPNISLATLSWIPDVDQAAMTQPAASNECGAYAMVGAVCAFGAFPQPAMISYANAGPQKVDNVAIIDNRENHYRQLGTLVYVITGILNDAQMQPVIPELLAAGNGYNSPAAMAKVAMDLGRSVPQVNAQAAGFAALNAQYPGERARCQSLVGAGNVDVNAGNYAAPGADETNVVCVSTNSGGLNWVAQGSDGKFYDPADGSLDNSWVPKNTGDKMGPYCFTGLWMVIR